MKNTLKRLGMEEEFNNWVKSVKLSKKNLIFNEFSVGTKFIVIEGPYKGHKGKVIKNEKNKLLTEIEGMEIPINVYERHLKMINLI